MLVWINGAFGSGKTTIAEALVAQMADALLYDPEQVGLMLGHLVPSSPTGDFQDLAIWRHLVADVAAAMAAHYRCPLVVPMTVVRRDYLDEIQGRIRTHGLTVQSVVLTVDAEELRRRITDQVMDPDDPDHDERIRRWRLERVDRCVRALRDPAFGVPINNVGREPSEVAAEIKARTVGTG